MLISEIIEATNGKLLNGHLDDQVNGFTQDTRVIQPGNLYIPLVGIKDGHDYIPQAFENGAAATLTSHPIEDDSHNVILVEDTMKALGDLARYVRVHSNAKVVGITGSAGKTSTKDMIASVISQQYTTLKTQGNFNNNIGLPLTILRYNGEEVMVIEMGMNHLEEIDYLTKIALPDIAAITNIGTAHIGELGSRENILQAKMEIVHGMNHGTLVVNNDNDLLSTVHPEGISLKTIGIESDADLKATDIILNEDMSSFRVKVDGKDYPVRSCAIKTVLERARISGHALNKVSKTVFAEILNYCMGVASGDSLIKIADEKVSAVHGGDPKDYTVMEMLPLFKATSDFLNREYPGNTFMTAHFDHSIATAIWRLDGQADKLLDTYHREIAAKGLQTEKMVPALRFSTSDVGMSGANLYPIFLVGAESRIVPLGYSIRTEHKNGVDMQYFEEQLRLVYAQFEKALDKQVQLMNIEIRYPVTTLMRVLKRIKAPKKASYEAMDYFVAIHGDSPCTAYELFMQMSDVIFSAQCDGASGLRIAQLEEIVSRALNVNWHEYDHPGDFKW